MRFCASIIIPTRNRATTLRRCLDSLKTQSVPADTFEVLVIDNGSSDNTAETAIEYTQSLRLTYVKAETPGLHVARHAGLDRAGSDILMYCDDDITANPRWVQSVVEAFNDPDVVLVGGNNLPQFEQAPPDWLQAWWNRRSKYGRALGHLSILDFDAGIFRVDPGYIWGCNFSIRKQVLLSAGGFHPDGMPADRIRWRGDGETHVSNIVRKKNFKALFHSGATVHHHVPLERMSPEYFQRRGFAQGISDSFTDLRAAGKAPSSRITRSGRYLKYLMSRTKIRFDRKLYGDAATQLSAVQLATLESYVEGYFFHQREASDDPALMAWILKKDYY